MSKGNDKKAKAKNKPSRGVVLQTGTRQGHSDPNLVRQKDRRKVK